MRNSEYECWNGDRDCSQSGGIDGDGVAVSSDLDRRGREVPDPTPLAPPVGFTAGPSLAEFVQRMIRQEISQRAAEQDFETFEEADDFDVEDDRPDPQTPYEAFFEPPAALLTQEEWEAHRRAGTTPRLTAEEWEHWEKIRGQTADIATAATSAVSPVPASASAADPRSPPSHADVAFAGAAKSGSGSSG